MAGADGYCAIARARRCSVVANTEPRSYGARPLMNPNLGLPIRFPRRRTCAPRVFVAAILAATTGYATVSAGAKASLSSLPPAAIAAPVLLAPTGASATSPPSATVSATTAPTTAPPSASIQGSAVTTLRSVKTGNWSDPSAWNLGRVPRAGDTVVVARGHSLTLSSAHPGARRANYRAFGPGDL